AQHSRVRAGCCVLTVFKLAAPVSPLRRYEGTVMSLREKTISGAKWSAIATVIIIGLGLVQMTVLARIIDNHQFGLLTISLVIIALADTLSDFGIANSIIQRKEIS